ncbi:hypothetical protein ACN24M_13280 [Streptomyces microflavus]|uniref:hypothetical protein n=1 Tax=Streptomyces microflavus TaxID=1919 RepID=UPI003B217078
MDEETHPPEEPAAEGGTVPLTWLSAVEDGRRLHFCETCARLHIRAIESRLDSLWW